MELGKLEKLADEADKGLSKRPLKTGRKQK
jgi:hypothetical protein